MYLGSHLLNTHRVSQQKLEAVSWRYYEVYHDNLHNNKAGQPTAKPRQFKNVCEGGNCGRQVRFPRLFGRWR